MRLYYGFMMQAKCCNANTAFSNLICSVEIVLSKKKKTQKKGQRIKAYTCSRHISGSSTHTHTHTHTLVPGRVEADDSRRRGGLS